MSGIYPKPLAKLIEAFELFPGIGRKTAQRLAFYTLSMEDEKISFIADAIKSAKDEIQYCSVCCNLSDSDPCPICKGNRNNHIICVVQNTKDVIAMEKTGEFDGTYHVLHGLISPMDDIGPDNLKIKELIKRLNDDIHEVIIATSPTVEGEATAMYLSKLIKPMGIKVSRIAHGIPIGTDIEFTDETTLAHALKGRTSL